MSSPVSRETQHGHARQNHTAIDQIACTLQHSTAQQLPVSRSMVVQLRTTPDSTHQTDITIQCHTMPATRCVMMCCCGGPIMLLLSSRNSAHGLMAQHSMSRSSAAEISCNVGTTFPSMCYKPAAKTLTCPLKVSTTCCPRLLRVDTSAWLLSAALADAIGYSPPTPNPYL